MFTVFMEHEVNNKESQIFVPYIITKRIVYPYDNLRLLTTLSKCRIT